MLCNACIRCGTCVEETNGKLKEPSFPHFLFASCLHLQPHKLQKLCILSAHTMPRWVVDDEHPNEEQSTSDDDEDVPDEDEAQEHLEPQPRQRIKLSLKTAHGELFCTILLRYSCVARSRIVCHPSPPPITTTTHRPCLWAKRASSWVCRISLLGLHQQAVLPMQTARSHNRHMSPSHGS